MRSVRIISSTSFEIYHVIELSDVYLKMTECFWNTVKSLRGWRS